MSPSQRGQNGYEKIALSIFIGLFATFMVIPAVILIIAFHLDLLINWAAVFISMAAFLSGAFIGFIFGLPRSKIPSDSSNSSSTYTGMYGDNSNLDQISDWLLKILIGVGLTQLLLLPATLRQYVEFIEPALGGSPSSGVIGISILVFFSVSGFLIAYLLTRRYAAIVFMKGVWEQYQIEDKMDDEKTEIIGNTRKVTAENKEIIKSIRENQKRFADWMGEITKQINTFEECQEICRKNLREINHLSKKELDFKSVVNREEYLDKVKDIIKGIQNQLNKDDKLEETQSTQNHPKVYETGGSQISLKQKIEQDTEEIKENTNRLANENKEIMKNIEHNQTQFYQWMKVIEMRLEAVRENQETCDKFIEDVVKEKKEETKK